MIAGRRTGGVTGLLVAAWLLASFIPGGPGPARAASAGPSISPPSPGAWPSCTPTLPDGSSTLHLVVEGTEREAIVHLPGTSPGPLRPAAVGFHGYSARADQLEATSGLSPLADELGFVVAYVQGAGEPPQWSFKGYGGAGVDDLALVEALLDRLVAEACVDPGRVVLFGHSMGGGMASAAACALADRVAGLVLVSAFWVTLPCEPSRPVPVLAMHALDDRVLPYRGGMANGNGPRVLPVEEVLAAWAERDGCSPTPDAIATEAGIGELAWQGCLAPVRLLRLESGGHDWARTATPAIVAMLLGG
jgi:polyhydroxybutyrate depolymerase